MRRDLEPANMLTEMLEGRMHGKLEFSFLMTMDIEPNLSIENENWTMTIEQTFMDTM